MEQAGLALAGSAFCRPWTVPHGRVSGYESVKFTRCEKRDENKDGAIRPKW